MLIGFSVPGRRHAVLRWRFGENLSTNGMTEHNVFIGDIYPLGVSVGIEVTQPRSPCFKLNFTLPSATWPPYAGR